MRAVRVVTLAQASGRPPLADEEASAWEAGLYAAQLLRQHFGDFYATHASQLTASMERLFGCLVAFWQLVEQAGLPIRWPHDPYGPLEPEGTPEETLTAYDWVSEEWLGDLGYSLRVPRPCYYGLGVQAMLDEAAELPNALTVALWHLFSQTPLAVGVKLQWEALAEAIGEEVLHRIGKLRPLPADVALNTLSYHLDIPEVRGVTTALSSDDADTTARATRMLIAYAFGQTGNELADYSDYEVEAINMGETDEQWDWSMLPRMITLAREAKALQTAYEHWSARVAADPEREVVRLARALRRAAREADRELIDTAQPLIALLGDDERDAMAFIERINAL